MTEQWRPVVGYEGMFEVSDRGRVRGLDRMTSYRTNRYRDDRLHTRQVRGRLLKPTIMKPQGYARVKLNDCNPLYVHILVLEAFVGPCPAGLESCHNDGINSNNQLSNLRWDTHQNNIADKVSHGTMARGEMIGSAKLTTEQVLEIRRGSEKSRVLATRFGVDKGTINCIRRGKTWKHLEESNVQSTTAAP